MKKLLLAILLLTPFVLSAQVHNPNAISILQQSYNQGKSLEQITIELRAQEIIKDANKTFAKAIADGNRSKAFFAWSGGNIDPNYKVPLVTICNDEYKIFFSKTEQLLKKKNCANILQNVPLLTLASFMNDEDAVLMLANHKNINLDATPSNSNYSALEYIVLFKKLKAYRSFLLATQDKKINFYFQNDFPLTNIISTFPLADFKLMVQHPAYTKTLLNHRPLNSLPLLLEVAEKGDIAMLEYILSFPEADINVTDFQTNKTLLFIIADNAKGAQTKDDKTVLQKLILSDKKINFSIKNAENKTVLKELDDFIENAQNPMDSLSFLLALENVKYLKNTLELKKSAQEEISMK